MTQTYLSTEAFAKAFGVKPQTLRAALCRDGHYFHIRPIKLPNRFLAWPSEAVALLLTGTVEGKQ